MAASAASIIWSQKDKPCYPFLKKLSEAGRPLDQFLGNILGVAVGASVNHAQATVNVVDFYLDDARTKERNDIIQLTKKHDNESNALLLGYISEGMRMFDHHIYIYITGCSSCMSIGLKPQFPGLW
jgi:linoleate 10R-lipoxygenase